MQGFAKNRGFSLVELSVVLVLIGIALGAVLKGEELIMNARIKSVISEVQGLSSAYNRFYEKYQQMPGDDAVATSEIPGCTAENNCANGNGDFHIGMFLASGDDDTTPWFWWDQTGYATIVGGGGFMGNFEMGMEEASQYWKHLVLSQFIVGVSPSAPLEPVAWGVTHPKASLDSAGYQVFYLNRPNATGHFLRLQKAVSGWDPMTPDGRKPMMSISPKWAYVIDRKIDDGYSGETGKVWATGISRPDGTTYCENTDYLQDMALTTEDVCLLMFKLD